MTPTPVWLLYSAEDPTQRVLCQIGTGRVVHDRRTDVNKEGWQVLSQFSHSASKKLKLRRYARRTNAISKKLVPHRAAFALHIAFYNWCRVHETLRVTPAIELGLINHIWSIGELLREAEAAPSEPLGMQASSVSGDPRRADQITGIIQNVLFVLSAICYRPAH